ncbi:MAG: hypothetical protein WC831_00960 [Parcubacteria group bacterium]|jgi:hypothetical protein
MPKVKMEMKGCTDCQSFRYTLDEGSVCLKVGLARMLQEKLWHQYNQDFHANKLFESIPDWCPIRL